MRSMSYYLAIGCVAVFAASAAHATAKPATPAKKAVPTASVTLVNGSPSAVVEFTKIEIIPAPAPAPKSQDWWAAPMNWFSNDKPAEATTRETNLLKAPLAPKKSIALKLGSDCNVTVAAKFEDGSSTDPVTMDFCKDKKLTLKAPAE